MERWRWISVTIMLLGPVILTSGEPALWPQPTTVELLGATLALSTESFQFWASDNSSSPLLSRAFQRYLPMVFLPAIPTWWPPQPAPTAVLSGLVVTLSSQSEELSLKTSEDYALDVPVGGGNATLAADTVFGALRGLETFSQLIGFNGSAFNVNAVSITDTPRFAWRGALVDTARHFQPIAVLRAFIDAMAYSKMNVFHWHITDDQSFPYVSQRFPALSGMGAYASPSTSHTYSPADVQGLVAFAKDRGVRVVVEFDTPGHSQSWGLGEPGLLTQVRVRPITTHTRARASANASAVRFC
jgi:hexosaminidase